MAGDVFSPSPLVVSYKVSVSTGGEVIGSIAGKVIVVVPGWCEMSVVVPGSIGGKVIGSMGGKVVVLMGGKVVGLVEGKVVGLMAGEVVRSIGGTGEVVRSIGGNVVLDILVKRDNLCEAAFLMEISISEQSVL